MPKKKKEYVPFKKHFWIPFILALTIVVTGIIMTLTNQNDLVFFKVRGTYRQSFVLTGPSVVIFGTILSAVLLYIKRFLK